MSDDGFGLPPPPSSPLSQFSISSHPPVRSPPPPNRPISSSFSLPLRLPTCAANSQHSHGLNLRWIGLLPVSISLLVRSTIARPPTVRFILGQPAATIAVFYRQISFLRSSSIAGNHPPSVLLPPPVSRCLYRSPGLRLSFRTVDVVASSSQQQAQQHSRNHHHTFPHATPLFFSRSTPIAVCSSRSDITISPSRPHHLFSLHQLPPAPPLHSLPIDLLPYRRSMHQPCLLPLTQVPPPLPLHLQHHRRLRSLRLHLRSPFPLSINLHPGTWPNTAEPSFNFGPPPTQPNINLGPTPRAWPKSGMA